MYNCYGPAECTVDAVWCRLDEQGPHPVIGRPGHNVRAYVLDRHGHLAPPGVVGELHLGGAQVSRGYLAASGPTAERFGPDPHGPAGARRYRTGDLVRWTEDGVLEYLGRSDIQLKVHGVRIEPQEIETVLSRHPHIAQVAVAAQPAADGAATGTVAAGRTCGARTTDGAAPSGPGPGPGLGPGWGSAPGPGPGMRLGPGSGPGPRSGRVARLGRRPAAVRHGARHLLHP